MRFILSALGTAGDVYPFIGLAKALLARGDQVTLLTGAPFVALARQEGITAHAILTQQEYDKTLHDPRLWQPNKGFIAAVEGFGLPAMTPAFDFVMRQAKPDTVILGSSIAFGARAAAEKRQLRYIAVHLSPAIFRSNLRPPRFPGLWMPRQMPAVCKDATWYLIDKLYYDPVLLPEINRFRTANGLATLSRLLASGVHAEQALALFPSWFAEPQADWVANVATSQFPLYDGAVEAVLDSNLDAWLQQVGKPILFTQGSGKLSGAEFLKQAMAACDNLALPGLLLSADPVSSADLPSNFRVERYVPFGAVLPRMRAIVHHGGIGTLSQALKAGIPHLVIPMSHDQHDNSARLQALGVARELSAGSVHATALSDTLYQLLNHSMVHACCQQAAARFANQDALAVILAELDQLLESSSGAEQAVVA